MASVPVVEESFVPAFIVKKSSVSRTRKMPSVPVVEEESFVPMDYIGDIDEDIPFEVMQNAQLASLELLPAKSHEKYYRIYNVFKKWQGGHGITTISSTIMKAYFYEMDKKKYKPTSMWAYYSMLKSTIRVKENIDIGQFSEVVSFLKAKSIGFKSVKAEVFTETQLKTFFDTATGSEWLDAKVVCIFGICGACRTDEFLHITVKDVEKHSESLYLVRLNTTKTMVPRSFTITGVFVEIVNKYISLRPAHADPEGRFFVNYQRGKCTVQYMGRNKFSKMPLRLAEFLQLPKPERYTGHSFRRTSATILANSGADMETIMRHGGWRNEKSAKLYIEDSVHYKKRTGNMIIGSILGPIVNAALPSTLGGSTSMSAGVNLETFGGVDLLLTNGSSSTPGNDESMPPNSTDKRETMAFTLTDLPNDGASSSTLSSLFDNEIDESELVQIAEHFSQRQIETPKNDTDMVYTQEISARLCSKTSGAKLAERHSVRSDIHAPRNLKDSVMKPSVSPNGSIPDAFKMFHFDKMNNCSFHFYSN